MRTRFATIIPWSLGKLRRFDTAWSNVEVLRAKALVTHDFSVVGHQSSLKDSCVSESKLVLRA